MIEFLRQKAKACGCSEKYPKRILQPATQKSTSAVSHVPLKFSLEREVSQHLTVSWSVSKSGLCNALTAIERTSGAGIGTENRTAGAGEVFGIAQAQTYVCPLHTRFSMFCGLQWSTVRIQ